MKKKIFTNGNIYTMNRQMPFAKAVVVQETKYNTQGMKRRHDLTAMARRK